MDGTVKAQGTLPYSVHSMRKSRQQHTTTVNPRELGDPFPYLIHLCLSLYHSVILPFLGLFVLLSKGQATLPLFILLLPQHPCGLHLHCIYICVSEGISFTLDMCLGWGVRYKSRFCSSRIWDSVSFLPPSHIPISLPISYKQDFVYRVADAEPRVLER